MKEIKMRKKTKLHSHAWKINVLIANVFRVHCIHESSNAKRHTQTTAIYGERRWKKQLKWWEIQVQEKQIFCLITSSLHSKSWLGFGWGLPLFKSTALNMFTHSKRNLFESTQYTRDWSFSLISCIIFPFVVISLFLHCFQLYLFNICLPFFVFHFRLFELK